jgi:tetratricopeptide (TPR) repeat protein
MLILITQAGLSQELTAKAHAMFKAGDYDSARVFIDQAIQTPEKNNSQTWQLRGLIYRKLETPENIQYREVALESFVQARKTDSTGIYKDKINEYLYNTIVRYYNDEVTFLSENKFAESERSYLTYKEKYSTLIDAGKDFKPQDIEYYNALGNGYSRQLGRLSGKDYEITFTLSVNALSKVLAIDSMNYLANLNTAVLYYNRGADLVENPDVNGSIEELIANIELSNQLFLMALPMMQKAYLLNPESPEVI